MNSIFPLNKHVLPEKEFRLTYRAPKTNFGLFDDIENEVNVMQFIIGEHERINVIFTDRINGGFNTDADIGAYIKNQLGDVYINYIKEWVSANFLIGDIVITRNNNNLAELRISSTIACPPSIKYKHLLRDAISRNDSLRDANDSLQKHLNDLTTVYNIERTKPIYKICIERFKRMIFGR